jgi:probable rRNA maturation factor
MSASAMTERAKIAVAVDCAGWTEAVPNASALARKAARAALAAARRDGAKFPQALELSLVLSNAARLRRLNRDYRRKNEPTNVLSFPAYGARELARLAAAHKESAQGPAAIGDVILAFEVARDEAAAQGKPLADHLAHLTVHGTLHLLGYDHERDADAQRMESLEVGILRQLGVADPYREAEPGPPRARAKDAIHG